MKLNISRTGEYIPTWEGNNKLPKEEQIIVKYKRMTGEMASSTMRFLDEGAIFDYARLVKICVTEIENLYDENDQRIKTADDLLKATGTHGLVTEIGSHILTDSKLPEKTKKK